MSSKRCECKSLNPKRARVITAQTPSPRLPPENNGRVSLRLILSVTVVSDYLFIGSGREELVGIKLGTLDLNRLGANEVYGLARQLGSRAASVKGFFKTMNPVTKRLQPAIPGSSLKGAARARIELASRATREKPEVIAPFLYDTGALSSPPPRGRHGWRHVRIWCESIGETRVKETAQPSIHEDLFGFVGGEFSLQSLVHFGTLYPVDDNLDCVPLELDHKERLCAVTKGATFRGEIIAYNVTAEYLGLILYSLGLDKVLCNKEPRILLGSSKYRCRNVLRGPYRGKRSFGVVKTGIEDVEIAPWSRDYWRELGLGSNVDEIVKNALKRALSAYPGLPRCFDEVECRFQLEPC